MAHASNPSTQEAEAKGPRIQGHFQILRNFSSDWVEGRGREGGRENEDVPPCLTTGLGFSQFLLLRGRGGVAIAKQSVKVHYGFWWLNLLRQTYEANTFTCPTTLLASECQDFIQSEVPQSNLNSRIISFTNFNLKRKKTIKSQRSS